MKAIILLALFALWTHLPADAQSRRRRPSVKAPPPPQILHYVDQRPGFSGDLSAWFKEKLHYPDVERESGNEGRVLVGFIVARDGSVRNVVVKRTSGFATFDREAIRVISGMPQWKPARRNGLAYAYPMIVPVTFRLR